MFPVMGRFRGMDSVRGLNIQFVQYKNHYFYGESSQSVCVCVRERERERESEWECVFVTCSNLMLVVKSPASNWSRISLQKHKELKHRWKNSQCELTEDVLYSPERFTVINGNQHQWSNSNMRQILF